MKNKAEGKSAPVAGMAPMNDPAAKDNQAAKSNPVPQSTQAAKDRTGAMQGLFNQKSLARINGPEELNDYVRATTPSVWIVLGAIALLVLGLVGWSIFGTLAVHEADGTVREVRPISFIIN